MDRQYLKQTKSSLAKTREPQNLRERLQVLSATVSELKSNVRQDKTIAETLERVEKQVIQTQTHQALSSQIQALRHAFTELADAVADEVERLQDDTKGELRREMRSLTGRVEALTEQGQTCVRGIGEVNVTLTADVRKVSDALLDIQRNQDNLTTEIADLKETLLRAQDDNKQVFEQMRSILHNNITHVATLQKGFKRSNEELKSSLEEIEKNRRKIEGIRLEREEIEGKWTVAMRNMEEKVVDLNGQIKAIALNSSGNERSQATLSQLSAKVQEASDLTHQRFDRLSAYIDDKNRDLERQFEALQGRMESGLKPPDLYQSEDREVRQRLEYLEAMLQTQRRELFASMTTLEQNSTKKHDSLVKAVYQIARELNLQNPLAAF